MEIKIKSSENRNWTLKRNSKDRQREYYISHPEILWEDIFAMIQQNPPEHYPYSFPGKSRVKVIWRIDIDKKTLESIHLTPEDTENKYL